MKKFFALCISIFTLANTAVAQCGWNNPGACQCPDGSQNCDLLPDMTASELDIQNNHVETPGWLDISNATPNIGWGPMEIHGSNSCWCDTVQVPCNTPLCSNGNPPTQQLIQRVYHKSSNTMTYYDVLTPGTMTYHPSHGNLHIDRWAWYSLRKRTSNPDARTWPIVSDGAKQSFCLINLGNCTNNYGYCVDSMGNTITMANIPNSGFGLITGCGNDQGIYVGYLDIYSLGLNDPIPLAGLCNGNYYVVSITDPDDNFLETNNNNNWVAVPITLTQQQPVSGPQPTFTTSGNGLTVNFINTSPPGQYLWDFGDGQIDTINFSTSHTYAAPGVYNVTLMERFGCWKTTTVNDILATIGISEPDELFTAFSAYPNPVHEQVSVSYYLNNKTVVFIELYNPMGQKVASLANYEQTAGYHELHVNIPQLGLSDGVYILQLKTKEKTQALRLVVIQ